MSRASSISPLVVLAFLLGGCLSSPRFTMSSKEPPTKTSNDSRVVSLSETEGVASYYADEFHGRKTSNGETYDMNQLTAAHRTLAFNTRVRVTNLDNGLVVVVRINDRGPFIDDRIIDLSLEAAKQIGMIGPGTARVRLEVIESGDSNRVNKQE